MAARDSGVFSRIQDAGPWMYSDCYHDGRKGITAQWQDKAGPVELEKFGAPRVCGDGLVYFPSKEPISQDDLCKRSCPPGIDYLTTRNVNITVPLASAAPRFVTFGAPGIGTPANEFAQLAYQVFDALSENITITDPRVIRLIGLAVRQAYRVTDELLDDLRWITSADIDPILCCIMGSDPKALPGEAGQLHSHA